MRLAGLLKRGRTIALTAVAALALGGIVPLTVTAGAASPAAADPPTSYYATYNIPCGDTAELVRVFKEITGGNITGTGSYLLGAHRNFRVVLAKDCTYEFQKSYDGSNALPVVGGDLLNSTAVYYGVYETVVLDGNGATFKRTGSAPFRFLGVSRSGATLIVNDLTLIGGQAVDGTHDANHEWWQYVVSITTQITMALATAGASSWLQGVANVSVAVPTVIQVASLLNTVRKGAMAVVNDVGGVTPGGNGGAIASDGVLELNRVTIQSSRAGDGGNGADGTTQAGAGGGSGGAVYVSPVGSLKVKDSTFTGNSAGRGGTGAYGASPFTGGGGRGGDGGDGGAIASFGPTSISGSMFSGNLAGLYGAPGKNWGVSLTGGNYGNGAAVQIGFSSGDSTIDASSFIENGNSAGRGGAIATVMGAHTIVTNSTFERNNASWGGDLAALSTYGGGLVNSIDVRNSTFTGSTSDNGGTVAHVTLGNSITLANSVVFQTNTSRTLCADHGGTITTHSLYADVYDAECATTVQIQSSTLSTTKSSFGRTVGYLPFAGSPLLNAGDPAYCPAYDQRGLPRQAGACDIGALDHFEWGATSLGTLYASTSNYSAFPEQVPGMQNYDLPYFQTRSPGYYESYLTPATSVMSPNQHPYYYLAPPITVSNVYYELRVFIRGVQTDITRDVYGNKIKDLIYAPIRFANWKNANVELWVVSEFGDRIKLDTKSFTIGNAANVAPTMTITPSVSDFWRATQFTTQHFSVAVTDPDESASWSFTQAPSCGPNATISGLRQTATSFEFDCTYGAGTSSSPYPKSQMAFAIVDDQGAKNQFVQLPNPQIEFQAPYLRSAVSYDHTVTYGGTQRMTFQILGDNTALNALAADPASIGNMHCGTYLSLVEGSQQASVSGTTLTGSFDCLADDPAGIGKTVGTGLHATWFALTGGWTSNMPTRNYRILAPVYMSLLHEVFWIQGYGDVNEGIDFGTLNLPSASSVASTLVDWGDGGGPQVVASGWAGDTLEHGWMMHAYTAPGEYTIRVLVTLNTLPEGSEPVEIWSETVYSTEAAQPVIETPGDLELSNESAETATPHYTVTATDPLNGEREIGCSPASGTVLPVGTTTVTCSTGNGQTYPYYYPSSTTTETFQVTVADVIAPVLGTPTVTLSAADDATTVDYSVPVTDDTATDLSCDVGSGTVFLAGTTTVTCTATDAYDNQSSISFLVNVGEGIGPSISVPTELSATSTNGDGVVVEYAATAADQLGAAVTPSCLPESGHRFAPGVTTVSCTATDGNGNWSTASFPVTVYGGVVTNWQDLLTQFSTGGQVSGGHRRNAVKLGEDVTLERAGDGTGQSLRLAPGDIVTLDLAGYALTIDAPAGEAGIGVPAGATLTIIDTSGGGTGELDIRSQGGGAAIGGAICRSAGDVIIGAGVDGTVLSVGGDGVAGGAAIGAGAALTSAVLENWGLDAGAIQCDGTLSGGSVQFVGAAYGSSGDEQPPTDAGGTTSAPGAAITWSAPGAGQPGTALWTIEPEDTGADGGIGFAPSGWLTVDLQGGASPDALGGPLAAPAQVVFTKASLNPADLFGPGADANPGVADPTRDGFLFGGWRLGSPTGPAWTYDRSSASTDPDSAQDAAVYASWIPVAGSGSGRQLSVPAGGDLLLDSRGAALAFNSSGANPGPGIHLPAGAKLTIANTVGSNGVTARGGDGSAGIGGGPGEAGGTLVVVGGQVTATGAGGAGVGGGEGADGGTVEIRGGQLTAIGNGYGSVGAPAGIGAGSGGGAGGTVTAHATPFDGTLPTSGAGPAAAAYGTAPASIKVRGSSGPSGGGNRFTVELGYSLTFHLDGAEPYDLGGASLVVDGEPVLSRITGGYLDWVGDEDPVKPGFVFAGWYRDAAFLQEVDPPTLVLDGPIDLYAKWVEDLPDLAPDEGFWFNAGPEPQVWFGKTLGVELVGGWSADSVAIPAEDVVIRYEWLRDGVPIRDAPDESTYSPRLGDLGKRITVRVTAAAEGYDPFVWIDGASGATGEGHYIAKPPPDGETIYVGNWGAPQSGDVLTIDLDWQAFIGGTDGADIVPGAVTYVWKRDGEPIPGAPNAPDYEVAPADLGGVITVDVTATGAGFSKYTLPAGPSGPVMVHQFTPPESVSVTSTCSPLIDGCWLYPVPGDWGAPEGLRLTYRWYVGSPGQVYTEIPRSSLTTPVHNPLQAMGLYITDQKVPAGKHVRLTVTATAPGYQSITLPADPVYVDGTAFSATTQPTIQLMDGRLTPGGRLRALTTSWTPGAYFTYQWYVRDSLIDPGTPIGGATGSQFTIPSGWDGKFIWVSVTGTKPGYFTETRGSSMVELPPLLAVDFDPAGGSAITDVQVRSGTKVGYPGAPSRPGFTFDGWFDEGGHAFDFNQVITYPRVITAHWTRLPGAVESWTDLVDALAEVPTDGMPITLRLWADLAAWDTHLDIPAGADVTIDLNGRTLYVESYDAEAAVGIAAGAELTIEDSVGTGWISANSTGSGAGIGGDAGSDAGALTVGDAEVSASGATGAGIGGGEGGGGGPLVVESGWLNIGSASGAGIGGGEGGSGGTVVIRGGDVSAVSNTGASFGAGAGGASAGTLTVAGTGLGALDLPAAPGAPVAVIAPGGTPTGPYSAYSVYAHSDDSPYQNGQINYGRAVHLDVAGGELSSWFPADFAAADGSPAYVDPAPTRVGHRFEGWFTDAARTVPAEFLDDGYGGLFVPVEGDLTLYAKWFELPQVALVVDAGSDDCAVTMARDAAYGDVVCVTAPGHEIAFGEVSPGTHGWMLDGDPISVDWLVDGHPAIGADNAPIFQVGADGIGTGVSAIVSVNRSTGVPYWVETSALPLLPVVNVVAPSIAGTTELGATLMASPGTWTRLPTSGWYYTWLRDGVPIGAEDVQNGNSYTLVEADLGHDVSVRVRWWGHSFGPSLSFLNTERFVESAAVGVPAIIRHAVHLDLAGGMLADASLIDQLVEDGQPAQLPADPTRPGHVFLGWFADAGATIPLATRLEGGSVVFDVLEDMTVTAAWSQIAVVPGTVDVDGAAVVGGQLTAVAEGWTPGSTVLSYRWYRNGIAIPGATSATYWPDASDLGKWLTVRVVGTAPGLSATPATSERVQVGRGVLVAGAPTLGPAAVGSPITVNPGAWSPGATLSYRWFRGGVAIAGESGATYTPLAGDLGKWITVRITGSAPGYEGALAASAALVQVVPGTLVTGSPSAGPLRVGVAATADPGTWPSGTTLTYRWYRGGVAIAGATGSSYTPVAGDLGKWINVRVVGKLPGYADGVVTTSLVKVLP